MSKIKKIFSSWRTWLLIIVLLFSVWSIFNIEDSLNGNIKINAIDKNSSAEVNGLVVNSVISRIDGNEIKNVDAFYKIINSYENGDIISIETKSGLIAKKTNDYKIIVEENKSVGINVNQIPLTKLKKGLDIVGGARVILKPNEDINSQQFSDVIDMIQRRLNIYGISDVTVRSVTDFSGDKYIIVEVAGASEDEIINLVSGQGKLEGKIGNETIFVGGTDIKAVCRDTSCSGVYAQNCGQAEDGNWFCRYNFRIDISVESAKKHAEVTSIIPVKIDEDINNRYLETPLDLYLDDVIETSLQISEGLKGLETTTITLSGPGTGSTKEAAINDALTNMNKMQTLLITGSLPVKLEISKVDIISPILGENFLKYALISFGIALAGVGAVILIRFRKLKIAIPILITGVSEIIIILGVAALINWNLDLAAIAGILAAIGTGVDHQIVISDEIMQGDISTNWKDKIKKAFFIIMAAYFTTMVAMGPLFFLGTGILKGFALTTMIGITAGVFITRPAFAKTIEILLKE